MERFGLRRGLGRGRGIVGGGIYLVGYRYVGIIA